jgi:hypothetical protein
MPVLSNAQLPGSPLNGSQQSFGSQLGQSISNGLTGAVGLAQQTCSDTVQEQWALHPDLFFHLSPMPVQIGVCE